MLTTSGFTTLQAPADRAWAGLALLVAFGMAATIGSALWFQHVGGYVPCKLCLQQREAYYLGLPFALFAVPAILARMPECVARGCLAIAGLCLLSTALLGVYHAGAEWAWWPGPEDCGAATAAPTDAGGLLQSLATTRPPSCTDAPWRFGGLSFAGWNAVLALALAGLALFAAARRRDA